ncbi:hypothetical protein C8Q74DRAFT_1219167 [Fomes fomentarius]|nr:hypothetical protein C8Q74DRAFT_1219167 [Fomes fomentarius]
MSLETHGFHSALALSDRCAHCARTPRDLREPLKRCKGCGLELYCGQKCQRSEYRVHKPLCRPDCTTNESNAAQLDYPTPMAMLAAAKNWFTIHQQNFRIVANIAAYLAGGVDHNLENQRAFVITIGPKSLEERDPENNPAVPFLGRRMCMMHKDDAPYLSGQAWDELEAASAAYHSQYQHGSRARVAGFAGILPGLVVLELDGIPGPTFVLHHHFPIYRTRTTNDTALDEQTRIALEDLMNMIVMGVSGGHSYRPCLGRVSSPPVVQETVSEHGRWKQKRIEDWNWDWMTAVMWPCPEQFKSGMHPLDLWEVFRKL